MRNGYFVSIMDVIVLLVSRLEIKGWDIKCN